MNYSKFSLFDRQIFDLFYKKIYRWMKIFIFQEISRRLSQKKFPGDWNEIPGDFQEVATLRHAHKDAIRNFINKKFRIFQARPGPARCHTWNLQARPGPGPRSWGPARPGPKLYTNFAGPSPARPGPGPQGPRARAGPEHSNRNDHNRI